MTALITAVQTRVIRVPLARPWGADVTDLGVIEVRITRSDGAVGHGFSWTPSIGATAVDALLRDDLAPWLVGRAVFASRSTWLS